MSIEFFFAVSILINKDLGFSDVYVAGIFIYVFQCLSYISCTIYFYKFKRKQLHMFTSLSILAFSLLILFFSIGSKSYDLDSRPSKILKGFETGRNNKPLDCWWFSAAPFSTDLCTLTARNCSEPRWDPLHWRWPLLAGKCLQAWACTPFWAWRTSGWTLWGASGFWWWCLFVRRWSFLKPKIYKFKIKKSSISIKGLFWN